MNNPASTLRDGRLAFLSASLESALPAYEELLKVRFGEHPPLAVVPGKHYSAKTTIPVLSGGNKIADMHAVAIDYCEGTGDSSLFHNGLLLPPLWYVLPQERQETAYPRSKTGVLMEAALPMFSDRLVGEGVVQFMADLEELSVRGNSIVTIGHIGRALASSEPFRPSVYLTTGYTRTGARFGDPHAIFNISGQLQVVGFIPITSSPNPLIPLLDSIGIPVIHNKDR